MIQVLLGPMRFEHTTLLSENLIIHSLPGVLVGPDLLQIWPTAVSSDMLGYFVIDIKTGYIHTPSIEKVEVLNAFFPSVFISKTGLWESQRPETKGKGWSKEDVLLLEDDQVMLDGGTAIWSVSQTSQFGIINELAEDILCPLVQVIDEYVEQEWIKY
ncbi:hypothetical protein llap_5669 [Limosa lapponica baueri]|uniref:Uncharacterized protein n=1 Tax=Limosa lapponica baueri TaxID=1758121 RepID=A0A2I0UDA5_LIMLA|nr:hypothetical protein llap_5669 [Limosa lapponica baueri]